MDRGRTYAFNFCGICIHGTELHVCARRSSFSHSFAVPVVLETVKWLDGVVIK